MATPDRDAVEHRRTAAAWHRWPGSPLYVYAHTGEVVDGLVTEIHEVLDRIEHGAVSAEVDVVDEHARLRALLVAVQPQAAMRKARAIGHADGRQGAAWWEQDAIGGRTSGDTTSVARRLLQGVEDGDPAILDTLPDLSDVGSAGYTADQLAELAGDCLWPEPDLDDGDAHQRWENALPDIRDAYEEGFREGVVDAVIHACRAQLRQHSIEATFARLHQRASEPQLRPPSDGLAL